MRKRVYWNLPHVRISLALCLALMVSAVSGCGGGSGSGPGPGPGPASRSVTGKVVDASLRAVIGATISITGGGSTQSASDGSFVIFNVADTATTFTVAKPDATFADNATYQGKLYDIDPTRSGGQCKLPLPAPLGAGTNTLPDVVQLQSIINNPPSPPITNCP